MDLIASAKQAGQRGQWADAASFARQAVAEKPKNIEARLVLGVVLFSGGDAPGALNSFESVLPIEPMNFVALNWAAMISHTYGDPAKGIEYARRAIQVHPSNPEPVFSLGVSLAKMGRLDEALPHLERAVRMQPNRPQYLYMLGNVFTDVGRREQAADVFAKATELEPTEEGFLKLVELQINLGNPTKAKEICRTAAQAFPASARLQVLLARACIDLEDEVEASQHLAQALELDPERVEVFVLEGTRQQRKGHFQAAEGYYRQAIEIEPCQGISYFGIVASRKVTEEDRPLVDRMTELVFDQRMPPNQRTFLLYGLGKAFDNLGDFENAIRYYDQANEWHRNVALRGRPFFPTQCHSETTQRIGLYTSELARELRPVTSQSDTPVFVLGMMRSGTTLLEQILSCHPEIGGAGELPFWAAGEQWYADLHRGTIDRPAIAKGSHEYVELLKSKAHGAKKVTDKNPANVMVAGLIHAALPNARIIHTLRDPVDTALSMWITLVETPPNFCCDRNNIVAMYREYQRITKHWRETIPADRYLEVSYEELVSDPEPQIRRVLSYLDLDWSERCLHHEVNQRAVTTPSFWQVRQPLYRTSTKRWKRYEQWIPEFLELRDELSAEG